MGARLVEHLEGPPESKERLKAMIETLAGILPVYEACERLGICEAMFYRQRMWALQKTLDALRPRPRGRRRRERNEWERRCEAMAAEIAELKRDLAAAQVRGEVQQILLTPASPSPKGTKKNDSPRRGRRPSRPR